jgi:MinD-like ATPase involved in chromosome partitioning or flagellar assembly
MSLTARVNVPEPSTNGHSPSKRGAAPPLTVVIAAPPSHSQLFMALSAEHPSGVRVVSTVRALSDLIEDVRDYAPRVVLLSPEVRDYDPAIVAQLVRWPQHPIAVVGLVPAAGTWGAEMTAGGAVAFYNLPVTPALVERFAKEAARHYDRAREGWSQPLVESGVDRKLIEAISAQSYQTGAFGFYSTKGGDGKTTLAVNVWSLLGLVARKKVLLVDADMNCGRVALHLNVPPGQHTLVHLADDYRRERNTLTGAMLQARLYRADSDLDPRTRVVESRLHVLFGITTTEHASGENLAGQQGLDFMRDLIALARKLYDFVLIDLGSNPQLAPHFAALEAADRVVLISTSDRTSLYYNREMLRSLIAKADLRPDKFMLVVNRYHAEDRFELKDIADFMQMTVVAAVPEDMSRTMVACVNEGRPFVLGRLGKNPPPVEATLMGLLKLAEELYPPMGVISAQRNGAGRGGLLASLFRRG